MSIGRIRSIHRYPVKSMQGETLDASDLGTQGLPGDRAWAVRDEVRGGIRGAKRFPELMGCAARYEQAPPAQGSAPARVTLPGGRELAVDDAALPGLLGDLVGSPVSVWPLVPADQLDHYRRGAPVLEDGEAELRRVFARTADEPLPKLEAFPRELFEFESPPGTYFDAFPLLIMTTTALTELARLAPGHRFELPRFRPNLVVEPAQDGPFPELDWVGRRIAVGSAEVEVTMACPRCAMTTHAVAGLPRDPGIMRSLVKHTGGELGVYARVVSPGRVQRGDSVTLLD
ncbi:MAG: MOSC domain-containing protein [Pseudomonadales bacterium]